MVFNFRKIVLGAACAGVVLCVTGCQSAKKDFSVYSPCITVSVVGNSTLPWYEEVNGEKTSAASGTIQNLLDKKFMETDPEFYTRFERLDYAEEAVRNSFNELLGIQVIEKADLVSTNAWKNTKEGFLSALNTTICATDLKDLHSISKYNVRNLCRETGAKGVILLNFEFFKKIVKGNKVSGEVSPYVTMNMRILDETGREQFYKTFKATGSDSVKIQGRDYDKTALTEMYRDVIDLLITKAALEIL